MSCFEYTLLILDVWCLDMKQYVQQCLKLKVQVVVLLGLSLERIMLRLLE